MADGNGNNNGNGKITNWILGIVGGAILLSIAGLSGTILLLSTKVSSLETAMAAQNAQIVNLANDINRIKDDIYTPRFSKPSKFNGMATDSNADNKGVN